MIATWGEALLRLSPPAGLRLRQARQLELQVGGSEANVAVGLASLGLPARWLSAVGDDELGETVLAAIRAHGVDVAQVLRRPMRTGLYFYEPAEAGRAATVSYDRAASAFASLQADSVDPAWLDGCNTLHTSGISTMVSEGAAEASTRLWTLAGQRGLRRSFDLNHRHRLGTPSLWVDRCRPFLRTCDLLFITERDTQELLGFPKGEAKATLARLRELAPDAEIVLTRAEHGVAALSRDGRSAERPAGPVAEVGRIGRGDAFAAGYLFSQAIGQGDLGAALERGVAAASYKSTLAGDLPVLDARAIEASREGAEVRDVRR